jgi:hypothetical protein
MHARCQMLIDAIARVRIRGKCPLTRSKEVLVW